MRKNCKICSCELTLDNIAIASIRLKTFRAICKPCRSQQVMNYQKNNIDKRKAYINSYVRKIGKVKQYPCETCKHPCYKKYARAFCGDKCRFMFYVNITEDCWIWKGALNRSGYGKFYFQGFGHDIAHRVSYKLFKGSIKDDFFVCHRCDNPACVNPNHLWLGTHKDNMTDMVQKNRQKSKLNANDVIKIRELVERFRVSHKKIMEEFNITSGTISNIIYRRIWKHI